MGVHLMHAAGQDASAPSNAKSVPLICRRKRAATRRITGGGAWMALRAAAARCCCATRGCGTDVSAAQECLAGQ